MLETIQLGTEALQGKFGVKEKEWLVLGSDGGIHRFQKGKRYGRIPGNFRFQWAASADFYLTLDEQGCSPMIVNREGFRVQKFIVPSRFGACTNGVVALSPSGRWIAASTQDGKVLIWNNQRLLDTQFSELFSKGK